MNTTPQHHDTTRPPTPAEARAALEQARATHAVTARDRRVYAAGTAAFGVVLGVFVPLSRVVGDRRGPDLLDLVYVVLALGIAWWQTRAARSIPRGAKRTGYLGLALSLVAALTVTMVVNSIERTADAPAGLLVLLGVAVAAPMLVAAALVARGRS